MVTLNPIFKNNMIMQANKPVRFFGEGDGLASVCFNGKEKSVNANGKWLIEFDSVNYGGPYNIAVKLDGATINKEKVILSKRIASLL